MGACSSTSPLAKYKLGIYLGHGAQGVVFKARVKKTGEVYAIKQCYLEGSNEREKSFKGEATIMKNLTGSPNVVQLIEVFKHSGDMFLV